MVDLTSDNLSDLKEKILSGGRIDISEALELYEKASLWELSMLATARKRDKSGDEVYYNRNFHIEPTNICIYNCKFCSYRRPLGDPDAWDYTMEEMLGIVDSFRDKNVTEVHIVGGVDPRHDIYYYGELISKIKQRLPNVTVKAFSAVELYYMITKAGLTLREGLAYLINKGMGTIPGGGAEIFDETIRKQICPDKCSSEQWLELHKTAHELSLNTNATILYGHIESIEHRLDHIKRLRDLQDVTHGFNAFIPLKYRNLNNFMSEIGETSVIDDLRTLAVSRIFLDNFAHIKAYWPMYGKNTTELALLYGADDIDGTIEDTTKIYSMAGAEDTAPKMDVQQIRRLITNAGFTPVERDSFYKPV